MEFTSTKRKQEMGNHMDNTQLNLLPLSQLKSYIPKPVPYIRRAREPRSKSCSSSGFNETAPPFCNPELALNNNKGGLSHNSKQTKISAKTISSRSHSVKTTNSSKISYSNVKAKIDNKTPVSLLLKNQSQHPQACVKQYKRINHTDESKSISSLVELPPGDQSKSISSLVELPPGDQILKKNLLVGDLLEKKKVFHQRKHVESVSTSFSESNNSQLPENLHIPEVNDGLLKKKYIFNHMEGSECYLLKECAPEFLSSVEKQMEEVSEAWLHLVHDLIITKMTIGKSALPKLSQHNPTVTLRDEIATFFEKLPTQGKLLNGKLCKIEEEQAKILMAVIQNIVALSKEHEEMKQKHCQLEESYNQTSSRLKEELAILDQENKELDKKYLSALDKYLLEKTKAEENEKQQLEIMKEILNMRQIIKQVEGKCEDLENRCNKVETFRLSLEESFKNLEKTHEKENEKYKDLFKRHTESKNIIKKVKCELEENEHSKTSLEEKIKELEDELTGLKTNLSNSLQKRAELEAEVSDKIKKMNELEVELVKYSKLTDKYSTKSECQQNKLLTNSTDNNNLELLKLLGRDIEQKYQHVQELKKKINRLEHMLTEKSTREEKLFSQVTKLSKKCNNKTSLLNTQIQELQGKVKHLNKQIAELEKILGQKILELDQRDRQINEFKKLIQLKNENNSTMRPNRKHDEKKCTGISVEVEHYITQNQSDKRFSLRHKKMIEMFSLMECKQMELMRMEHRLRGLQKFQEEKGETETNIDY